MRSYKQANQPPRAMIAVGCFGLAIWPACYAQTNDAVEEGVYRLRCRLANGAYTEAELGAECQSLLAMCWNESDQGRVYAGVARIASQRGAELAPSTVRFAERALQLPQNVETRLQLALDCSSGMIAIRHMSHGQSKYSRGDIARVLLEGLRTADEESIPQDSVPLPSRGLYHVFGDTPGAMALRKRLEQEQEAYLRARREALRVNDCVELRRALEHTITTLYNEPDDESLGELRPLGDELELAPDTVERVVAAVQAAADERDVLKSRPPSDILESMSLSSEVATVSGPKD